MALPWLLSESNGNLPSFVDFIVAPSGNVTVITRAVFCTSLQQSCAVNGKKCEVHPESAIAAVLLLTKPNLFLTTVALFAKDDRRQLFLGTPSRVLPIIFSNVASS